MPQSTIGAPSLRGGKIYQSSVRLGTVRASNHAQLFAVEKNPHVSFSLVQKNPFSNSLIFEKSSLQKIRKGLCRGDTPYSMLGLKL